MGRLGRAAGITVAGISIALGASFAAPSLAEEANTASTISYTQHAANAPILAATNALETSNELPKTGVAEENLPAPVALHAVATVEPAPEAVEPAAPVTPRSLSELVDAYDNSGEVADAETECLAIAIYFEAKSEPLAGQLAVADVIINRRESGRFPASICGVVKQRGQFSFVRGGRLPAVARSSAHWRTAVAIAQIAQQELSESKTPNALFFHARRVSPGWRLTRVGAVGNHVFYR